MTSTTRGRRRSGARFITLFAVLLVLLAWWLLRGDKLGLERAADASAARAPENTAQHVAVDAAGDVAPSSAGQREVVAIAAEVGKGTGQLDVEVRYADGSAASDVGVGVKQAGVDPSQRRWSRTDAQGHVLFAAVPEGRVVVTLDRAIVGEAGVTTVVREQTASLRLTVQTRLCVAGVVLGADDAPVAGAEVIACDEKIVQEDGAVIAHTDAAGRFEVRTAFHTAWVGARAARHGASRLQRVVWSPDDPSVARITIRLQSGGGLTGTVRGPDGKPVAAAIVRVGEGELDTLHGIGELADPLPGRARTDDAGRYVVDGLVEGKQAVVARAVGFAPWTGSCSIAVGQVVELPIVLARESRIVGRVEDDTGKPVADATVRCGVMQSPMGVRSLTDRAGRFALGELAPGRVQVFAVARELGSASAELDLQPGAEQDLVLVLSREGSLRGHVLLDDGAPLAGARVELWIGGDMLMASTDLQGAFEIPNVRSGEGNLRVQHPDAIEVQQQIAVPTNVTLTTTRKRPGRGAIHGRVVAEDGTAVRGAEVDVLCMSSALNSEVLTTDANGEFRIDKLYEGTYRIRAHKGGFPVTELADRRLDDGASWEVGDVVLVRGGTIRVVPQQPLAAGIAVMIYHFDYRFSAYIRTATANLASELVRPGTCRVFVTGEGIASEYHEVEVIAGQETVVNATCGRGWRRSIEARLAPGGSPPSQWLKSYVKRDGHLVAMLTIPWEGGKGTLPYCLAPGVYEVQLESGAERKTVPLVVAERDEDAPVGLTW